MTERRMSHFHTSVSPVRQRSKSNTIGALSVGVSMFDTPSGLANKSTAGRTTVLARVGYGGEYGFLISGDMMRAFIMKKE